MCHEVNRAICGLYGPAGQLPWDQTDVHIKQSVFDGVAFHAANPKASASTSHENWLKFKAADGWTYGPEKDPVAKTHPCIRPFEELPKDQQLKDHVFRAIVHTMLDLDA